jgi:hypothetical protein
MPYSGTGSYTIRTERWCKACKTRTPQMSGGYSYNTPEKPHVPNVLIRTVNWICQWCDQSEDEVKEVAVPTDRLKIIRRFLSLSNDYDLLGLKVEARADELVFRVRLPDFDMGEMRTIQFKQQETGFITADELLRLRKAGFNRPREVPPRPEPRDSASIREKARQRAFGPKPYEV